MPDSSGGTNRDERLLPTSIRDEEGIKNYINRIKEGARTNRWDFERPWYENIMMYLGKQWFSYDRKIGIFRPKLLKPWVPQPVTNRLASTADSIIATVGKIDPQVDFRPATNEEEDITTADISGRIFEIIKEEVDFEQIRYELVPWVVLTGNGFLYQYYSKSREYGMIKIPNLKCALCDTESTPGKVQDAGGVCPKCTVSQELTPGESFEEYPRGKLIAEVVSPFEIYVDMEGGRIELSPYLMRVRSWNLQHAKNLWPEAATDMKADSKSDLTQKYLEKIAYTGGGKADVNLSGYAGTVSQDPRVTIYEIYIRPTEELPDGLYAVMVGDLLVEKGPIPYHDSEGNPIIPIVHFKYKQVPGRLWGKTPVDDLVPKQRQRNELESFIMLIINRMAAPGWFLPINSGAANMSGEPGWIQEINTAATGGAMPIPQQGIDVPQSVTNWLEKIDQDFEELAKTFNIIKGQAPRGVSAYSALQLLDERGQAGFADIFLNFQFGWKRWAGYALDIFREYADDERIRAFTDEVGSWAMEKFKGSDLTGKVNVSVETGVLAPRSQVARRAVIEQALNLGIMNPQDPQVSFQILQMFGIPELAPGDIDVDIKEAAFENDTLLNTGQIRPPKNYDNHLVHAESHRKFLLSHKFKELQTRAAQGDQMAAQAVTAMEQHYSATIMFIQMAQQAAAQNSKPQPPKESSGTGGPGGGGTSGPGTEGQMNQRDAQKASSNMGNERPQAQANQTGSGG